MKRELVIRTADIGGTQCRRADIRGGNLEKYLATGSVNSPDELVDFVCGDLPVNCMGVAISVAGIVENGIVVQSPNISMLNEVNLAYRIERKSRLSAKVYNDMDGGAAGMFALLSNQGIKVRRSLCMTWSTGIGARVVDNGTIVNPGAEMSHFVIDKDPSAPKCGCELRGCVESLIGGISIKEMVIEITKPFIPAGTHPCTFLDQEFDSGKDWAFEVYFHAAKFMAQFLAVVMTTAVFQDVIYKGTFGMSAFSRISLLIKQYMKESLMVGMRGRVDGMRFIPSPDPENDALHGSAALFLKDS